MRNWWKGSESKFDITSVCARARTHTRTHTHTHTHTRTHTHTHAHTRTHTHTHHPFPAWFRLTSLVATNRQRDGVVPALLLQRLVHFRRGHTLANLRWKRWGVQGTSEHAFLTRQCEVMRQRNRATRQTPNHARSHPHSPSSHLVSRLLHGAGARPTRGRQQGNHTRQGAGPRAQSDGSTLGRTPCCAALVSTDSERARALLHFANGIGDPL